MEGSLIIIIYLKGYPSALSQFFIAKFI